MKLLVVSHSSVVGAYQGKLRELARRDDLEVHLVIPHAWIENNRLVSAQIPSEAPYKVHVVRAFRLGYVASFFYNPMHFSRIVRNFCPDVVYAEEEPWSVAAWQSMRAAKSIGARFVFFTWENVWRRYKWISERILIRVLSGASAAVVGSAEAESILRRRGFNRPLIKLPQYGIDPAMFQHDRENRRPSPSETIIAYLGRLEREKGVDLLLHAMTALDQQCSLLVVGEGKEKQSLIATARELGLDQRVRFPDGIPHEKVPELLQTVDIVVLPSITTTEWKEQFGRILVEAMASGIPVVGSDSGTIPEVVGDAGMVFPEGDANALTACLQRLVRSPESAATLGRKGQARAMTNYTNAHVAEELHRFFRMLTAESN